MKFLACLLFFNTQILYAAEYGTFMLVKGHVLILSEDAKTIDAKVNSKINVGETVVTDNDSRAKIVMSDRNIINVLPNTKLKIEKYSNEASDKNVKLKLVEGKIRSNVEQKYDNKSSKFEIRTATAVAGVRGTQFITSYNPGSKTTEVITLRGEVLFTSLVGVAGGSMEASNEGQVVVHAGEKSQSKDGASASEPIKIPKKELEQIDKETSSKEKNKDKEIVKDHKGDGKRKNGRAGDANEGGKNEDIGNEGSDISQEPPTKAPGVFPELPPSPTTPTQFDKSKVKIIIKR